MPGSPSGLPTDVSSSSVVSSSDVLSNGLSMLVVAGEVDVGAAEVGAVDVGAADVLTAADEVTTAVLVATVDVVVGLVGEMGAVVAGPTGGMNVAIGVDAGATPKFVSGGPEELSAPVHAKDNTAATFAVAKREREVDTLRIKNPANGDQRWSACRIITCACTR